MGWLVALFILITALAYLFLAPLCIEINTSENLFRVRYHKLASAVLLISGDCILLDLRITWWKKQIDLLAPKKTAVRVQKPKRVKKTVKRKCVSFVTIRAVLRTFKIRRFFLTADTGNPAFNGAVFPVVYAAGLLTRKNISVNFCGRNELILNVQNNIARITRAFIYSSLKTKTWKTWMKCSVN